MILDDVSIYLVKMSNSATHLGDDRLSVVQQVPTRCDYSSVSETFAKQPSFSRRRALQQTERPSRRPDEHLQSGTRRLTPFNSPLDHQWGGFSKDLA